jgi:hypothetical protein
MAGREQHETEQGGKSEKPLGGGVPSARVLAYVKLAILDKAFNQLDHTQTF